MAQTKERKLVKRAVELSNKIAELKQCYKEMDEVTDELIAMGFKSDFVNGQQVLLVDNFADKNCVFRTHGVRRYEIQVMKVSVGD